MNPIRQIAKNISILFLAQLVTYMLGFFTLAYSARYLGLESFGILSFAMAFTSIFGIICDLGLNTLAVREVAREKSLTKQYSLNFTLIKFILAAITFLSVVIAANLMGLDQTTTKVVFIFTLSYILTSFSTTFYSIFQAYEKMEFQSLATILNSIIVLIGVLLAIKLNFNLIDFSYIYLFSSIIVLVVNTIIYIRKFKLGIGKVKINFWKRSIKEALPFAITSLSITIYLYIDSIMLSMLQGPDAVGIYNAAYKLVLMTTFIPIIFNTALFPIMSRYFLSSKRALHKSFEKLAKSMFFIGIPMGVGTFFISQKLILYIYGYQFIDSVAALQILIWSAVLIFARSPFEKLLESSNRQVTVTKIFGIGVIFNVLANLLLIPKYSYLGSSTVTIFTDILVLIMLIFVTNKIGFGISKITKTSILKISFASLVMGFVLHFLLTFDLNLILIIVIASIVYITTSILLNVLDEEDFLIIKAITRGEE